MPKLSKAVAHAARAKLQVIEGGRDTTPPSISRSIFDRLRHGAKPLALARELGVSISDVTAIVIDEAQRRESKSYQRGWSDRGRLALYPLRAA
jgi:hypothetical protein